MAVCDAPVSDSRPRPALHAGLWRDPSGRGCPADPSPAEESQSQRGCRAVRPLYERGVSQSRRPPRRRARASPRGRVRRPRPSRAKPPGTRQPAPATTATVGEPGRRRSAAGVSGRIAQFLPPGGRMRGRPIKRTLRPSNGTRSSVLGSTCSIPSTCTAGKTICSGAGIRPIRSSPWRWPITPSRGAGGPSKRRRDRRCQHGGRRQYCSYDASLHDFPPGDLVGDQDGQRTSTLVKR